MISSPKTPAPAATVANVDAKRVATNEQAIPLPYFGGRAWLPLVWAQSNIYNQKSKAVTQKVGKSKQTTGYDYYGSIVGLLACCQLDYIEGIEVAGKLVWSGTIARDEDHPHHSGDIVVDGVGTFRVYWGTPDQPYDDLVLTGTGGSFEIADGGCGEEHPRYLDQPYIVGREVYFGNNNATVPTVRVLAERAASFDGLPVDRTREGTNPVTLIAELIGNEFYGLGQPELVHGASAAALAADVRRDTPVAVTGDPDHIAAMGFLSPTLDRQQPAQSFIARILEHFDGWVRPVGDQLYFGQFPHDGVVPEDLPELSYHDFTTRPRFEASDDADLITEVTVSHFDRDGKNGEIEKAATPVPNPSARRRLGYANPKTIQRPFILTTYQAAEQGNQLARHYSRDEESCEVSIRRQFVEGLHAGDLFVLVDAPSESSQVVRITQRVDAASSGEAQFALVLERGLAPLAFVPPPNPRPTLPDPDLVAIAHARIFQLPTLFSDYGPAPAVVVLAERPGAHVAGYTAYFSPDNVSYDALTRDGRWTLRATLAAGIDADDDPITVNASGFDLAILAAQSDAAAADDTLLLIVGFEILSIGSVTALGGGQYQLGVLRGRRGSSAATHLIAAECYIIARSELDVLQNANFPRSIATQHFKFASYTVGGAGGDGEEQDLSDALHIAFTFDDTGTTAPGTFTATAKAEAIFLSWTYPAPPEDQTIIATDVWERSSSAVTPDPDTDAPTFTMRATGFNRGGLAAGAARYYWAVNRDTIGRSALVGPVNATALAAPTGAPGATGPTGPTGPAGANGTNGINGLDGPGVPYRGPYDNTKAYYYVPALRRDAVFYSGQYWATNNALKNGLTTWDPPGVNADWIPYGTTYSAVATELLLAVDATITKTLTIGTDGSNHGIIQSANYVTSGGTAGWQIKDDGYAAFRLGSSGIFEIGSGFSKFSVDASSLEYGTLQMRQFPSFSGSEFRGVSGSHKFTMFAYNNGSDAAGITVESTLSGKQVIIGSDGTLRTNGPFEVKSAGSCSVEPAASFQSSVTVQGQLNLTGANKLDFTAADSGGTPVAYMQESWGINLWGDATHPIHVRGASLVRGGTSGGNYSSGNIYGFGMDFNPASTLPNAFNAGTTTGSDHAFTDYLVVNTAGGTIYIPYRTSTP